MKNRRPLPVDICVPQNLTIADLSTINAQAMRHVLSGDLEPGAARALVQMSGLQMRILEGAHYEERLTLLENQIASLRTRPSSELPVEDQAGRSEVSETSDEVDEHGASSKLNESEKKASAADEQAKEEFEELGTSEAESDQAPDPSNTKKS